jgi:hypothetical protein
MARTSRSEIHSGFITPLKKTDGGSPEGEK